MDENNPVGILDIVVGPGTATSLKKFWAYCLNSIHPSITKDAIDTCSYNLLKQRLTTNADPGKRHLWFGVSPDTSALDAEHISIESSTKVFLEQISNGLKDLKNNIISKLVIGSYKQVSCETYEIICLRLGKSSNNDMNEFYAELADDFFFPKLPNETGPLNEDNLHDWTVSQNSVDQFSNLIHKIRTNDSLATYCMLNVEITNEEIHNWLKSIARTALALHNRTFPCGKKNIPGIILSNDYVFFDNKSPWIYPPDKTPSAACFMLGEDCFSMMRLRESKPSDKPYFFDAAADLFVFSAAKEEDLVAKLNTFSLSLQHLDYETIQAYTKKENLQIAGSYRVAIVATDKNDLNEKIKKAQKGICKNKRSPSRVKNGVVWNISGSVSRPKIAGVFPGQGSQHFNMLKALCTRFPKVRNWFDNLDQSLVSVNGILPSLTIFPPSGGPDEDKRALLLKNLYSQEGGSAAVIVSSIALHELLVSFGCVMDTLVGHSSGEISAMIISGMLRFETKASLFETLLSINKKGAEGDSRGEIPKGKFLAVTAPDERTLKSFIEKNKEKVLLAMDNCPQQKVLFFSNDDFDTLHSDLIALGVICFLLYFDRAYHTHFFEVEMPSIREVYDSFELFPPAIPVFNCIELVEFPDEPGQIKEMAGLNWTNCVRFQEASEKLSEKGIQVFIEIGAGGVLSGFIDNTLHNVPHKALVMDQDGQDSYVQLLNVLANLFVEGVDLDLRALYEPDTIDPINSTSILPEPEVYGLKYMPAITETVASIEVHTAADSKKITVPATNTGQRSKAAIMRSHFALMNEFLQTETNILNAILTKKTGRITHPTKAVPSFIKKQPVNEYATHERSVADLPLIDAIIFIGSTGCICKRTISRERDLFLQHHTFGRFISKIPKDGKPLPVVPLAMTIEMIAEAASLMAPDGYKIVEISNLKAMRWVIVDNELLHLILDVKLLSVHLSDEIKVSVNIYDEGTSEQPYCTSIVTMKAHYPGAQEPSPFSAGIPESVLWDAESFFEQCLFHGEAFSCMDELLRLGKNEIEVKLTIPRKDILFLDQEAPEFKTSTQLLDSPGHITAYWMVENGDRLFGIYPISIDYIRFFSPPALAETELIARGRNNINGTLINTELEVLNMDGSLFMSVSGFKTIYYKLEASLLRGHYWTGPNSYFCNEIVFDDPCIIGFEANTIKGGFHEQSSGIWTLSLLHMYCNSKEKKDWLLLPEKGKRRIEWLLGRIAAKEIIRKWAFNKYCVYITSPDIEIAYDGYGRPFGICSEIEALGVMPDISITHSNMQAISIAADPGLRVGVDVEYLTDDRRKNLTELNKRLEIAFDKQELDLLKQNEAVSLLSFVCAKEAAAKAIGVGLLGSMKLWKIKKQDNELIEIEVANEIIQVSSQLVGDRIISYCAVPLLVASAIGTKVKKQLS